MKKKRGQKSNRVFWAPDVNLCQVKLFSSEDCPSQVGWKEQDHIQAKASWILHSEGMESNPQPPGFGGGHYLKSLKGELSLIPLIKWKCPPKFALSCNWLVAAGEESKETEAQKLREMRVLKAVYPRLSDIPPSPSFSLDIEEYHHDDRDTPLIPITPIEEEDPTDLLSGFAAPVNASSSYPAALPPEHLASRTPKITQSHTSALGPHTNENPGPGKLSGSEADVFVAASAAFTAVLKSTEQGSLIDTDLLIQIFKNPKMIEKLMNEYGAAANTGSALKSDPNLVVTPSLQFSRPEPDIVLSSRQSKGNLDPSHNMEQPTLSMIPLKQDTVSITASKQGASLVPAFSQELNVVMPPRPETVNSISSPKQGASPIPLCSRELNMSLPPRPAATGNLIPQPTIALKTTPPLVKDMNYYKSLIMQHGGECQDTRDQNLLHCGSHPWGLQETKLVNNLKKRKPKIQKPCMYFNSSKGCRNGSNCPYQHDMYKLQAGIMLEAPSAKRIKLGMKITGRT